jgi:hypothetical protein
MLRYILANVAGSLYVSTILTQLFAMQYIPGIIATVALIMINCVRK